MLIIDVRTPEEFARGHIQDAVLIEYQNIIPEIFKYTNNKDAKIGLYCAAGARSGIAAYILEQNGFTNAINLGAYEDLLHEFPNS